MGQAALDEGLELGVMGGSEVVLQMGVELVALPAEDVSQEHLGLQVGVLDAGGGEASSGGGEGLRQLHPSCSSSSRACSLVETASISGSSSPSRIRGRLWRVRPMRWSVTRSCG